MHVNELSLNRQLSPHTSFTFIVKMNWNRRITVSPYGYVQVTLSDEMRGVKEVHGNTMKHLWHLQPVDALVLVITDSLFRVARCIPPGMHVQVFPGAKLHHIVDILTKYEGPCIPAVVIAAGINNRDSPDKQAVRDDMWRAVQASKAIAMEVWVAQVMFHPSLLHYLPGGLHSLNRHIRLNYNTLHNPSVQTGADGLHLTASCATRTLQMWSNQLKL